MRRLGGGGTAGLEARVRARGANKWPGILSGGYVIVDDLRGDTYVPDVRATLPPASSAMSRTVVAA